MMDSSLIDAHPAAANVKQIAAELPNIPGNRSSMERFIENITYDPAKTPIYNNLQHLLSQRKAALSQETSILFFMNGDSGFGSQLTQYAQNAYFLYTHFNPRLYCYPYFYKNNDFFKYHEEKYAGKNTFFMYFRAARIPPANTKIDNIYFIENRVYSYFPFFIYKTPPVSLEHNFKMLQHFYTSFNIRIGENVFNYINQIRENESGPVIGVHVRSAFQKRHHSGGYLETPIRMRLEKLHDRLKKAHGSNYTIFLATDTKLYIKWCIDIFGEGRVQYIENIERIENEEDSVPNFKGAGFKLGADILYDCLALSLCNYCYVSNSNIPFIINMLNLNVPMYEY
jgi:hypothetical protein